MSIRIAINGFGRIGRAVVRAWFEHYPETEFEIIAINDLSDLKTCAHLLKYDTAHGKFKFDVTMEGNALRVGNKKILFFNERDPVKLPWKDQKIDLVLECSGKFATPAGAKQHLQAGAQKVIISAPAGKDVDATIVYGVNDEILKASDKIISNASCTTNCLAALVKPLHESLGVERGLMTTIHAYTNDQVLVDTSHADLHRARAAAHSLIPTRTGAASAVGLVLPELAGKLDGLAIRVPTLNVSLVDLSFIAKHTTTTEEVNTILRSAAKKGLKGVLEINEEPLVSVDFNHTRASAIVDVAQTKVIDNLVKVFAWYDNEWGFANRMIDVSLVAMRV